MGAFSLKRYRFNSKELDSETGYYYYGARYYMPYTARWISPDPIGLLDGLNIYQFALNNPLINVDRNGMQSTNVSDINPSEAEMIAGMSHPDLHSVPSNLEESYKVSDPDLHSQQIMSESPDQTNEPQKTLCTKTSNPKRKFRMVGQRWKKLSRRCSRSS